MRVEGLFFIMSLFIMNIVGAKKGENFFLFFFFGGRGGRKPISNNLLSY